MNNIKQEPTSLIMCVTPLQMLIAEKIIELNPNRKFDLLVIALNNNSKYHYYYQKLKKRCFNSLYYTAKPGINGFFDYIKQLKKNKLNKKYQHLYLASINSRHFQYIYSKNHPTSIYTFDDGAANIIQNSIYYSSTEPVFWKKIIWYCVGVRDHMKNIKENSLIHYTIYKDLPNIINNTQLIQLYTEESLSNINTSKVVKIYLGQPLKGFSDQFDDDYILNILSSLEIDYYYPHPREENNPIGRFTVIESPLIFEDYIVDYLKDNLNLRIEVYSFISTAILNVANLDRVNVKYIYNSYLYETYKDFYDFIDSELKIELLNTYIQ